MKIYSNELGHMTNTATMPIYGKNLKKSSSPEPNDLETWYVALSMQVVKKSEKKSENYYFWKLLQSLASELLEAFNQMS